MLFNFVARACTNTYFQSDLTIANVTNWFSNSSTEYSIDSITPAISIESTSDRPHGSLLYNFKNAITINSADVWITFEARINDNGNNTIPNFDIEFQLKNNGNPVSVAASTVNSLGYSNITYGEWKKFYISSEDLGRWTSISGIKFKNIDVSILLIKNIMIQSADCESGDKILVLSDFRQSNYIAAKKTYINTDIIPGTSYTMGPSGISFKKVTADATDATVNFRINPQCNLKYTGISFIGKSNLHSIQR
eukprot:NODE_273_length_11040_cov_1.244036.p6 type:complete len:250 gc:universal NODE_273_length_11040_cov_1.244036:5216-5965(+)